MTATSARTRDGKDDRRSTGGPTVRLPLLPTACRMMAEPPWWRRLSGALESPGSTKARQPAHDPRVGTVPRPGSIGGDGSSCSRCHRSMRTPMPAGWLESLASPTCFASASSCSTGPWARCIQEHDARGGRLPRLALRATIRATCKGANDLPDADPARRRLRHPPPLPRGRRRHHLDEHVQRDAHRDGRLRPRAVGRGDEPRSRPAGPRGGGRRRGCRRPGAALGGRGAGPDEPHRLAVAGRQRPRGARASTFEQLADAYLEAARGLVAGGADLLLIETIYDTLNAKAAIFAVETLWDELGSRLPLVISGTITDLSGRTLSGQTVAAFWDSVRHARPLAVGLNCALGGDQLRPYAQELAAIADTFISLYPNAGLPNAFGGYDETPTDTAKVLRELARGRPAQHRGRLLRHDARAHRGHRRGGAGPAAPRVVPVVERRTRLAGLEPLDDRTRHAVRQRRRAHERHRLAPLRAPHRRRTATPRRSRSRASRSSRGAQVLDINMDEGLLDSEAAMTRFLRLVAAEPDICRVPVMIDSSKWSVIEAGLRAIQGRPIVNSVSLKEGEAEFLRQARLARRYGAAVVVMAFDEAGQADTVERKVAIATARLPAADRRGRLRARGHHHRPQHLRHRHRHRGARRLRGRATSRPCAASRRSCPASSPAAASRTSRSPSAATTRSARRSTRSSSSTPSRPGSTWPSSTRAPCRSLDDLEPDLRERVEDLVLDRRPDATERLLEVADEARSTGSGAERDLAWRDAPVDGAPEARARRGHRGLGRRGHRGGPARGRAAARRHRGAADGGHGRRRRPVRERPDVPAAGRQERPGHEAGGGASHPLHRGRASGRPRTAGEDVEPGRRSAGRIVMATVKGDVHDIGKNIVGVVLGCNDYEVIDLGVMVPWTRILETAKDEDADLIGLSGLITPSLEEMRVVASEMERAGFAPAAAHRRRHHLQGAHGGAARARLQRAGRPRRRRLTRGRRGGRAHGPGHARRRSSPHDAPSTPRSGASTRAASRRSAGRRSPRRARRACASTGRSTARRPARARASSGSGRSTTIPLEELVERIDWSPFFATWELSGRYPEILSDPVGGRRRTRPVRRCADDAAAGRRRAAAPRFAASSASGRRPPRPTTTSCCGPTSRATASSCGSTRSASRWPGRTSRPDLALSDFTAPLGSGARRPHRRLRGHRRARPGRA